MLHYVYWLVPSIVYLHLMLGRYHSVDLLRAVFAENSFLMLLETGLIRADDEMRLKTKTKSYKTGHNLHSEVIICGFVTTSNSFLHFM